MAGGLTDISSDQLRLTDAHAGLLAKGAFALIILGAILAAIGMGFGGSDTDKAHGLTVSSAVTSSSAAAPVAGDESHDDDHGGHFYGYIKKESWLHSYLTAYCAVVGLVLGALFFVILQHLTRAGWSITVRRLAECVSMNIILMALLAIPLILGADEIWMWYTGTHGDPLLVEKTWYLTSGKFLVRTAIFFIGWIVIARFFFKNSTAQDVSGSEQHTRSCMRWAPMAMIFFVLSITGFAFDFLMSLDSHWFSTMFGVYYFAGCFMSFMGFLGIMVMVLQQLGYLKNSVTEEHLQDIGKLCFAFVVFWAYVFFSQYMLIWYANIPEETGWFLRRQTPETGWRGFSFFLFAGHFALPFFFLMSKHIKRNKVTLSLAAAWLLVMHWLDMHYLVMGQTRYESSPWPNMHDLGFFMILMGVLIWGTVFWLRKNSLLCERDPRLTESVSFHNA